MAENIDKNYLELFLITSQAAGLEPSEGRPLGAGKSTFALYFAYRAFAYVNGTLTIDWANQQVIDETPYDEQIEIYDKIINNYLYWRIKDLLYGIKTSPKRLPAVVWDDVQLDCPAWQHVPRDKRELIEELSIARPLVANIVMTAPSMSDIAKPLRRQVCWEIIIPQRGVYEVQFIAKKRDFYNPTEDLQRLWYDATGSFPPLPPEVMEKYNKRREQVARQIKEEQEKLREKEESPKEERESADEEEEEFQEIISNPSTVKKIKNLLNWGYTPTVIARKLGTKKSVIKRVIKLIEEGKL
jgi:hypothetical protein